MLGDSAAGVLSWHALLLAPGVAPVVPSNPRNTDNPLDIEYRAQDRITEHSEDVQLRRSVLDETDINRAGVERTSGRVRHRGSLYNRICTL